MTQTRASLVRPDFSIYTAAFEPEEGNSPLVRMVGSSTEQDVQRNRMAPSAIRDMTDPSLVGMTIFLNHSYNLPHDVYGILAEVPKAQHDAGFIDVHLAVTTDTDNPPAMQTLSQIRKGAKHGCSIGCMVLDWDFAHESDNPMDDPIVIKRVQPIEWSVVGIPANRRSWVENAIAGVFTRSLEEGNYDAAYSLAPTMRSLYSRNYDQLILSLNIDTAWYRRFDTIVPRQTPDYQIMWVPPRKTFVMLNAYGGTLAEGREQIRQTLDNDRHRNEIRKTHPLSMVVLDKQAEVAKRLVGVTSPEETERMLVAMTFGDMTTTSMNNAVYVKQEDGTLSPWVSLSADDQNAAKKAQEVRSHKYGIGIKEGGNTTKPSQWSSVPDAEWGDPVNYRYPCHDKAHADNAASRWGDASNRAQYSSEEQSIIGGRIKRRQASFGESSDTNKEKAMPPVSTETQPDLTNAPMGGPGEVGGEVQSPPKKKPSTPHVDNDGTTGLAPEGAEAGDYNERDLGAEHIDGEQNTPPNDAHSNPGRANNAGNDAATSAPSPNKSVEDFLSLMSSEIAEQVLVQLASKAQLTPEQDVHVRAMHDHANAILGNKGCDNARMTATQKAAAQVPPEHEAHAQAIHDHAMHASGGKHCAPQASPTDSDAPAQGQGGQTPPQATRQAQQTQKSAEVTTTVPNTALTLAATVPWVQSPDGTTYYVTPSDAALTHQLEDARRQMEELQQQLLQLKGHGLGRPTQFTGRQYSIPTNPVGVEERVQSPEELYKQTTIRKRYDGLTCRFWPAGLGAMQRPELTSRQMSYMSTRDENDYYEGREVLVPLLSDED